MKTTETPSGTSLERELTYQVNHVFLPPKTPQEDDIDPSLERALMSRVLNALEAIQSSVSDLQLSLLIASEMLRRMLSLRTPGRDLSPEILQEQISGMKISDCFLLHLRAQNAGLLVTAKHDEFVFETFELLATNSSVTTCSSGRLIRHFPGPTVIVARSVVLAHNFLSELAHVLSEMDCKVAPVTRPKTQKAKTLVAEERDTVSPILVTCMLVGLLRGIGRDAESVVRIRKHSREQTNWQDTKLPWHRSASWLLLRVGLRLVFDRAAVACDGSASRSLYKPFMAYFMGTILQQACKHGLPSDTLFIMNAKIARRLHKLDPAIADRWVLELLEILRQSGQQLNERWGLVQKQEKHRSTLDFTSLNSLDFGRDSSLVLKNFHQFLDWVDSRLPPSDSDMKLGDTSTFSRENPSRLPDCEGPEFESNLSIFKLIDVESWVELHLQSWLKDRATSSLSIEEDMRALNNLIKVYYVKASSVYKNSPESVSCMYLTIMELWVALDKRACQATPLLLKYTHGFPTDMMGVLVLPRKEQMARLQQVEQYLSKRSCGRNRLPFEDFSALDSFAVRYFDESPDHQTLMNTIIEDSERRQELKYKELDRLRQDYESLSAMIVNTLHQTEYNEAWGENYCKPDCTVCNWIRKRDGMYISVYEWPLPAEPAQAKAAVFEICVPESVAIWRGITLELLAEVFRGGTATWDAATVWYLFDFNGLSSFRSRKTRAHPASTVKPFTVAHYSSKPVPEATRDLICVPHGCRYEYVDSKTNLAIRTSLENPAIPKTCSFAATISTEPLSGWVASTAHTSNDVVALQSECPAQMRLDAFRAFGHLRAGVRIQWLNILCQLMAPALDFDSQATSLLILQASGEAGPADVSLFRMAHDITQLEHFLEAIADAMSQALDRIEESWEHSDTLACLVILCVRLISLASEEKTRDRLHALASRLRAVAYNWSKKLLEKYSQSTNSIDNAKWSSRAFLSLLTCITTFDIDNEALTAVLNSENEAAIFVEASLHAYERQPASGQPADPVQLALFQRWRRIAYRSQQILGREITAKRNSCLDRAIKQVWCNYQASNTWDQASDMQEHVMITTVPSKASTRLMRVSYNLLTGSLLVNGSPLTTLPNTFRKTNAYLHLFGTKSLDVMPSTAEDMQFSATMPHEGFEVHFAMTGMELIVRAVRDGRTLEYVPSKHFQGDIPTSFAIDYSHWLDLDTREVEFRPSDNPWLYSSDHWIMRLLGGEYFLAHKNQRLVEPKSATGKAISAILRCIETAPNLHLIFNLGTERLDIDLPRVGISFFLHQGRSIIVSKQYEGMCIDETQEFGSLVGLHNKMVLRPEVDSYKIASNKRVIIPEGSVSYRFGDHHVQVTIQNTPSSFHHIFLVDKKLGRLVDRGSLRSKLLLTYLHALTSHCLPDPLTGRTGAEESLGILRSGAVMSFQRLDSDCDNLLHLIAAISPNRHYYPSHLKVMEKTKWSAELPSLSQHEGFHLAVKTIKDHAADCELFCDAGMSQHQHKAIKESQSSLINRAMIRNSSFRVSEFGAEDHSTEQDKAYPGRDNANEMMRNVYRSTSLLDSGSQSLQTMPPVQLKESALEFLGSMIKGPSAATGEPELEVRFSSKWLTNPRKLLPELWCSLDESLISMDVSVGKYRLMFFFAGMIFAENSSWDVVQFLLARSIIQPVRSIPLPNEVGFNRSYGLAPSNSKLKNIVRQGTRNFAQCPEYSQRSEHNETNQQSYRRRHNAWRQALESHVHRLSLAISALWPRRHVNIPYVPGGSDYINTTVITNDIQALFEQTWLSREFDNYLSDMARLVKQLPIAPTDPPRYSATELTLSPPTPLLAFVAAGSLFARRAPCSSYPRPVDFSRHYKWERSTTAGSRLSHLLCELTTLASGNKSAHQHESQYTEELRQSFDAYQSSCEQENSVAIFCETEDDRRAAFLDNLSASRKTSLDIRQELETCLQPRSTSVAQQAVYIAGIWPRISSAFFLQRLSRHHWHGLQHNWKKCLTSFALSLAYLQQAERLLDANLQPTDLIREITSSVHTWDPLQYPESLLLEVEQGLLIRKVQDDVASHMRDPRDDHSSVVQLNMGEGKSSVIVPIIAAALAEGTRLVRVIVGKAQSKQMAHILASRLGGLLDRRIFFLPFSRSLRLGTPEARKIQRMMHTCRSQGGVLLVQPEHILSFQLMGLEYRQSSDVDTAAAGQTILDIHDEWGREARDIVDESDDNFSVRFELIYTMGSQQPVDYSRGRWNIIQEVLQLIWKLARTSHVDYGTGLQYEENEYGGFPIFRILELASGNRFLSAIAKDICAHGLRGFPIQHQPRWVRKAVLRYICEPEISSEDMQVVQVGETAFGAGSAMPPLLLLRGLFAKGILSFVLHQKRFRVNYGLAPDRRPQTLLAVPYRAKDSPAPRSEFSHPDVVIVLTCLSYYYRGLSNEELKVCFERLSKSDSAEQEYDTWAQQSSLHSSFRYYASVNMGDHAQCVGSVFPALRHVKPVVDFYLSHVVFPKEMREFPSKLSASGWDLAKRKKHPLTGFSGTNDSKYVLPLPIRSLDLAEQQHTNAAVLDCLLRIENSIMEIEPPKTNSASCQLTANTLLSSLASCKPEVQVILDVGAQIIELDNKQMAERWLAQTSPERAEAVIFFNDHDDLLVLTRNSAVEKFLTSPYCNRTDRCLVFLDQAHTRGTDLRLPDHFRAAVTLGPKITKDALVQACMRMRKLGRGQSVIFCVSPEMQQKIRVLRNISGHEKLAVTDVLVWSISETWDETLRSIPLWATQGVRHQHQSDIWSRVMTADGPVFSSEDIDDYLEDEAQTLKQRYKPGVTNTHIDSVFKAADGENDIVAIKRKCEVFGVTSLGSATLQEEQERELATEIEDERQDERPPRARPNKHSLHPDVEQFLRSGYANHSRGGIIPAFYALSSTSAAREFPVSGFDRTPQELSATADFAKTIQMAKHSCTDSYQRPVQWILTGHHSADKIHSAPQHLLILSPWEANELLPRIQHSKNVALHLYSPRMSLSLRSLDNLTAFTLPVVQPGWAVPKLMITQLNLFAGHMYLASYDEYSQLCNFLGVAQKANTGDEAIPCDGFIGRHAGNKICAFESSPLRFLNVLYMNIRGDCLDIRETHLSKILSGEILLEDNFEIPPTEEG